MYTNSITRLGYWTIITNLVIAFGCGAYIKKEVIGSINAERIEGCNPYEEKHLLTVNGPNPSIWHKLELFQAVYSSRAECRPSPCSHCERRIDGYIISLKKNNRVITRSKINTYSIDPSTLQISIDGKYISARYTHYADKEKTLLIRFNGEQLEVCSRNWLPDEMTVANKHFAENPSCADGKPVEPFFSYPMTIENKKQENISKCYVDTDCPSGMFCLGDSVYKGKCTKR